VKWVVIDEVHELVDSKRGVQLAIALERLKQKTGRDFQTICLSATVGSPEKVAQFFSGGKRMEIVKAIVAKELKINVVNPKSTKDDEKISEALLVSPEIASRVRLLRDLILSHNSTLIFTNTRDFAEILSSRLKVFDSSLPIETHHSSLSKEVRIKAEREFKREVLKSLIATSSLELGIDIGSIDFVVQYQSPRETARVVQRVGRSGHKAYKVSEGVIITTDEDDIFESAVIARRALNDELEPLVFHEKSLDVLAHQIVGLTLDYGKIDIEKAFRIIKKAYPYRNITLSEFLEVCKFLERLKLIWLDGYVKKRKNGIIYYFSNLSTIPDVKQYRIINILTNQPVGSLDEEFVALHGTPGTTFIVKGEPWRIVSVDERRVFVEPSGDIEAAIPGWEGELIPVPFEVAQEVGKLRRLIKERIEEGYSLEKIVKEIRKKYPVDFNSAKKMVEFIKKQMKFGFVPDDESILIEAYDEFVILHCCFGSRVNETLGRFLVSLLSMRFGSIGLRTDPYRIILRFPEKKTELIKNLLLETNPELLEDHIDRNLIHSELFNWKFIHVAKRFGAIRKDAKYGKYIMEKIIMEFVGTPIFKETLREIKTDKLDVEKAKEVIKMIQEGRILIKTLKGLSPFGKLGLKYQKTEIIGTLGPVEDILKIFKKRLKESGVRLICMNCGEWSQTFKV
ncbi:MAG TPA: DEAD/DEAH box helicase, partial [Candidatus Aenigmarchaeota archaeon]|nr:DEAD/DEAH box helicase [Candidatus Aenigmarchaeota archaeon]